MADTSNTQQQPSNGSNGSGDQLTNILTSLQQGVVAINNLTNTIKVIFPSSS